MRRPAHADVIITQGNDAPRRAGLTTVHYHGDRVTPHSYAVASSFDIQISGWDIAGIADAHNGALLQPTHVRFGFSQDRVHTCRADTLLSSWSS